MKILNKNFKMRLTGIFLVMVGIVTIVYSIFYTSGIMTFLTLNMGFSMIIIGLRMLDINLTSYPF